MTATRPPEPAATKKQAFEVQFRPVKERFGTCWRCGEMIEGDIVNDEPTINAFIFSQQIIPIRLCKSCASIVKTALSESSETSPSGALKALREKIARMRVVRINGSGTWNPVEIHETETGYETKELPVTGDNDGRWNVTWLAVEYWSVRKLLDEIDADASRADAERKG